MLSRLFKYLVLSNHTLSVTVHLKSHRLFLPQHLMSHHLQDSLLVWPHVGRSGRVLHRQKGNRQQRPQLQLPCLQMLLQQPMQHL